MILTFARADPRQRLFKLDVVVGCGRIAAAAQAVFSFKPADIVSQLDLLRPIYRESTHYGHFAKENLPWESTSKADALKAAL